VQGDGREVGAVAAAGRQERLAERQVDEHPAEGTDRAGDADQPPGMRSARRGAVEAAPRQGRAMRSAWERPRGRRVVARRFPAVASALSSRSVVLTGAAPQW
jgi:hypothetical protein